jgi:hypothetical protein
MSSSLRTSRPVPEPRSFTTDQPRIQVRRRLGKEVRLETSNTSETNLTQAPIRLTGRTKVSSNSLFYFASLEADSHLAQVQDIIRDAIRRGTIRVQPIPGCVNRVRISQVDSMTASEIASF